MSEPADTTPDSQRSSGNARSLGLRVPEQSPPPVDSILLDPRETAAWFESLPMANIGETARQVFSTLVDFNRFAIPELVRAKTVEQFRSPVAYITYNLRRHYLDLGLPLSPKAWKTATLARELNAELAISYKIIIERMLSGSSARFDRKLLVISLHRAMEYLGNVLLQASLVYADWPPYIWREVNGIYAYAYQNKIHRTPVRTAVGKNKAPATTIEDVYKSLVLLATASPHRLRPSQNLQVFGRLTEWSRLCSMVWDAEEFAETGQFNVDLWSDEPPVHNALRKPSAGRRYLVYDVRELLKKLRADFDDAPWEAGTDLQGGLPPITRPLLRQLILSWNQPPNRRFVRTRLNFELHVVAGLNTIHANLMRGLVPEPDFAEDDDSDTFANRPLVPSSLAWTDSPINDLSLASLENDFFSDSLMNDSHMTSGRGDSDALFEWATPVQKEEPVINNGPATPHRVKTRNESAGGYCIQWAGEHVPKIKVGEVVGIESASHRHQYGLGVVRWLRHQGNQEVDIGLQVISAHCEAGEIRQKDSRGHNRTAPPTRCLLIPAAHSDPTTDTASLLVSHIGLQIGATLTLEINGSERQIKLTKLIEYSSAFAQYQFSYINQGRLDPSAKKADETDFEDLWGSL